MKKIAILMLVPGLLIGCGGTSDETAYDVEETTAEVVLFTVEPPPPLEVPERLEVASDDDWDAKVHNKNVEVLEIINIINPVAAYITEGFKLYGDSFSPTLQEEWEDTQAQLGQAMTLYDSCKERMAVGEYDHALFLDLEEVWQLLVKTGVAGMRTKSMIDGEVAKLKG